MKKLWGFLLAIILLAALAPAALAEKSGVNVGDENLEVGIYYLCYKTEDGKYKLEPGGTLANYNAYITKDEKGDGYTLWIKDLKVDAYNPSGIGRENAGIYCDGPLTIVVSGDNYVSGADDDYLYSKGSHGIWCYDSLTITGSGTLTATGKKIAITQTSTFNRSYGIWSLDALKITDGCTVIAQGGDETTTKGTNTSCGIYAKTITIENSTVTASGGNVNQQKGVSCGIKASTITIKNSTVTASGRNAYGNNSISYGIHVSKSTLSITGGITEAEGYTKAIHIPDGNLTMPRPLTAWLEKGSETSKVVSNNAKLTAEDLNSKYIRLIAENFIVTYHSNTEEESITQDFSYGEAESLNKNTFKRPGYRFTGWNTKADGSGTEYTDEQEVTLNRDIALYAQWAMEEYTITYDLGGGIVNGKNPTTYNIESDAITLINPTRTDYVFMGWTGTGLDDAAKTVIIEKGSTGDRAYTAQWQKETRTVTYDANGGDGTMDQQSLNKGEAQNLTKNAFTRPDYRFSGWNTKADGSGTAYADGDQVTLTENITLYAQWQKETRTVTYNSNGGDGTMDQQVFNPGETQRLTMNAFYRPGYYFTGWNTKADGTGTRYVNRQEVTPTGNITLYAQWEEYVAVESYTVFFEANGGEGRMDPMAYFEGEAQTLSRNKFTREGYAFVNWNTRPDGSGSSYADGASIAVNSDMTLYAQWKQNENVPGADGGVDIPKQPVSAFVADGQKAVFTVEAQGEGLSYQWYIDRNDGRGWRKLDGANAASYTTSAVDADCNGFRYYCEITDASGNRVKTDAVTLYVTTASDVPETGDSATPVLWLMLSMGCATGMWLMRRRIFAK